MLYEVITVSIRAIKRFLADYESEDPKRQEAAGYAFAAKVESTRPEKIAIIGSGPSGIAAAADLARKGYKVTIFEKEAEIGGLLRYGIGAHRLPRHILDRELQFIQWLGRITSYNVCYTKLLRFTLSRCRIVNQYIRLDCRTGIRCNLTTIQGCL